MRPACVLGVESGRRTTIDASRASKEIGSIRGNGDSTILKNVVNGIIETAMLIGDIYLVFGRRAF